MTKEYMLSLTNAAGTKLISMKTLCEEFGLDYNEEVKRMKKEGLLKGDGSIITAKTLVQSIATPEEVTQWDEAQNKALIVDDKKSWMENDPKLPDPWGSGGASGFSGASISKKSLKEFAGWFAPPVPEPKQKHKAKKKITVKKEPPPEERVIGFDRWDFVEGASC
jgi:hypothetical protein